MAISRNWRAIAFTGFVGFEIRVTGEANTGMLTVMPGLEKRNPQGINPTILHLDLLNASDAVPENFQRVQYNERLESQDQYEEVEIFHNDQSIMTIHVEFE